MPYVLGHVYLASKLSKDPQFILGNIFPDISHLISKDTHAKMLKFAELYSNLNGNQIFYDGVKNHFRIDAFMHPQFVYKKMRILKEEFKNVNDMLIHGLIEAAMDVEIHKKNPWVSAMLRGSLKHLDTNVISIYLADYLHMNRKKINNIVRDGVRVIDNKNIYSIKRLMITGLLLRKYSVGKKFWSGINIRDARKLLNKTRDIIKDDYQEYLDKTFELTKKRLKVEAKNWYTLKDA